MPRHTRVLNVSTGETTIVEFTPEEELDKDEMEVVHYAKLASQAEADEQTAALKTSGKAKLAALGLTDDEINALTN